MSSRMTSVGTARHLPLAAGVPCDRSPPNMLCGVLAAQLPQRFLKLRNHSHRLLTFPTIENEIQ